MRYDNTSIIRKDNKIVYSTTFYPQIPIEDSDVYAKFPRGTRLENIAHKYYGDTQYWWIIARANGLKGSEVQVDPAKSYRIPIAIQSILREFAKLNG